jgi:hypothetical protein
MNTSFTFLVIAIIAAAVIALGYFAARQLIKAFRDDGQNTPIEGRPLTDLCDCEAGAGKKGRYYHAINCRYRQVIERNL